MHKQSMPMEKQLVDLITKGNVDDVHEFLDSSLLAEYHFRHRGKILGHSLRSLRQIVYRESFVTRAAACGHVDIIDALIARGFGAKEQVAYGNRWLQPILAACREGHLCVVKSLVENHNARVDVGESLSQQNPFKVLLSEGKRNVYPIAQYLLKIGVNLNRLKSFSSSLCVDCIRNHNATPDLLTLVLSLGGDFNKGRVRASSLLTAVALGRVEFLEILLDAGADVKITSGDYQWAFTSIHERHKLRMRNWWHPPGMKISAFMLAAAKNNLPVLKVLYSHGADPDYRNNYGLSALHIVAGRELYDIARYLIVDIGVALDIKDMFGDTPFILSVAWKQIDIAKLILKAGYDPKAEELEFVDCDPIFERTGVSELLQEVRQLTSVPRTLKDLCIFGLRHLLCRDLPNAVESLPLPNPLKNLIRLTHL